jgi:ATP-dependent DNA helicase RecQ
VARVKESFGASHIVSILRGENTENIRKRNHNELSTYGLLKEHSKSDVRDWVHQLIGQGLMLQVGHEYPILKLTDKAWEVMRGQRGAKLIRPVRLKEGEKPEKSRAAEVSWEGVDMELFEALRLIRREFAAQQQVSPFIIFSDATLRDMARLRPSTMDRMRLISGVGDKRLQEYGAAFLKAILDHSAARNLPTDVKPPPRQAIAPAPPTRVTPREEQAFRLFREESVLEDVMHQMNLARSTLTEYLVKYIQLEKPRSIRTWVSDEQYQRVMAAARQVGTEKLKPIYLALGEQVPYDIIRLVVAHMQVV